MSNVATLLQSLGTVKGEVELGSRQGGCIYIMCMHAEEVTGYIDSRDEVMRYTYSRKQDFTTFANIQLPMVY